MRRFLGGFLIVLLALTGVIHAQQPITDLNRFLLDTRTDLEILANEALGDGVRPEGWTFNLNDLNSPTYVADLWFDNEQLATELFGTERPADWIGAPVTQNVLLVARNIRHDLELTANDIFGSGPNDRPEDWRDGPALFRCSRTLMNTVQVLRTVFDVDFQTAEDSPNYCFNIQAEADEQVLRVVLSGSPAEQAVPEQVLAIRGDLERLADEKYGLNTRPANWIGNKDVTSATLLSDNFLDLETLANEQLGIGQRPEDWLTTLPGAPIYAYRALRFNLELLANALGYFQRPRGWQGTVPSETCALPLQNLLSVVEFAYGTSVQEVSNTGNYCANLGATANGAAESPPVREEAAADERFVFEAQYAFTYLDVAATQYMGVMPGGTRFKAWYRNFGDSTMMFVSGDDFAVFIDRRWTSMSQETFEQLPTLEGVKPLTFCDAGWCNGPGPTPTPTGSGAIQALLDAGTPPPAPDLTQVEGEKVQVSWNYIRVTYLLDNQTARTAQVTLEICADTAQTDCEPVTQIFDNNTGTIKPVVSQSNGLNVYEFPYGYSSNLVIEGATRFSPDVWISDPTIR
jgi:hypothetical protein